MAQLKPFGSFLQIHAALVLGLGTDSQASSWREHRIAVCAKKMLIGGAQVKIERGAAFYPKDE